MPTVSVVLPVFNGAEFLQQAIDSMLKQSFADFELIVVDDASTDDSAAVVTAFTDPRITLISNPENLGLPAALNVGIAASTGEFIARQDQDDFSDPERLAMQLSCMHQNPDLGLLGTWARILTEDASGSWQPTAEHRHPTDDASLRLRLFWNNPFVHSSVMMRASVLRSVGGYAAVPVRVLPEDFDLWTRMARIAEVGNVPELLQSYRQTSTGLSRVKAEAVREGVERIARESLRSALPERFNDETVQQMVQALNGRNARRRSPRVMLAWTRGLLSASSSIKSKKGLAYARALGTAWLRLMRNSVRTSA